MNHQPPYYILFSHSSSQGTPSNILGHPEIQYHYANDSPSALVPRHPNEHVLVLDFDPFSSKPPTVQSTSKGLAVTSLKVEEAPGAAAATDDTQKDDKMYVIETIPSDGGNVTTPPGSQDTIIHFKRRNAILRQVLLYPNSSNSILQQSYPPGSPPHPNL